MSKRGNGYGTETRVNILKKVKVGANWNLYPAVVEPNGKLRDKVRVRGKVELHTEVLPHRVVARRKNTPDHPAASTTASNPRTCSGSNPRPNHQAPAVLQPDFGPRVAGKLAEHSATCTSTNLAIHETTRPTKHLLFSDSRGFGRKLGEEGQQLSEGFFSHWFLFTRH